MYPRGGQREHPHPQAGTKGVKRAAAAPEATAAAAAEGKTPIRAARTAAKKVAADRWMQPVGDTAAAARSSAAAQAERAVGWGGYGGWRGSSEGKGVAAPQPPPPPPPPPRVVTLQPAPHAQEIHVRDAKQGT